MSRGAGYGARVDELLARLGSDLTDADFASLCIACADQAGVSARAQKRILGLLPTALAEDVHVELEDDLGRWRTRADQADALEETRINAMSGEPAAPADPQSYTNSRYSRNPGVTRVGGPCDHRRCLERAHPDGCRMFAPAAFEMQPGDAELVERLHADGWYTGAPGDHDAMRRCTEPGPAYEQRSLTPAQYRALKRLEQGRKADER